MPHQDIPEAGASSAASRIISPSLSSATSCSEGDSERSRDARSPSPELDLSSPEYDDGTDQFTSQTHPPTSANIENNRRAQSPPLEKDEKEFTQTANFLHQRRQSQEAELKREASLPTEDSNSSDVAMDDVPELIEETEESAAQKNSEAAAALFGHDQISGFSASFSDSSPSLRPSLWVDMSQPMYKFGECKPEPEEVDWTWSMKSPENVELHELDDLLGEF
jgi:hypothetical protein